MNCCNKLSLFLIGRGSYHVSKSNNIYFLEKLVMNGAMLEAALTT